MKKAFKATFLFFTLLSFFLVTVKSEVLKSAAAKSFFELKIYHLKNNEQLTSVESFLKQAFVPALHKAGISTVGVFKPVANDTATDKKIYILVSYKTLDQFINLPEKLQKNAVYQQAASKYSNTPYDKPVYDRLETILMQAFEYMPGLGKPKLTGNKSDRIYELRSYESATEKTYKNKVKMFNQGGEVTLFDRLGFNTIFYADVISGSRMPNLMYMTSFENMASRDEHWKTFSDDPEWKKLSGMPEYQNNVSKIDITFLKSTDYSDL